MQAQTRCVAKLSKYSSRKPNQRTIDLTALFLTAVEKLSRKEHRNRLGCSQYFSVLCFVTVSCGIWDCGLHSGTSISQLDGKFVNVSFLTLFCYHACLTLTTDSLE